MTKPKLLTGLLAAGLLSAAFGSSVLPASAQLRSVTATLASGRQVTMVVDIPPGASVDSIRLPGITEPIVKIVENAAPPLPSVPGTGGPGSPTPVPTQPTPPPAPTPPPQGPATVSPGEPQAAPRTGHAQRTTGRKKRKAQLQVNTGRRGATLRRPRAPRLPGRTPGGAPTASNPTASFVLPNAAPIGVPDFFIDKFRVPAFLLPMYIAAGNEYGVPWQVLAAINEIETDYGRNLSVSSAGAEGWMQFLPATWAQYGVDATQSGTKDPYNPADAIFAAARYLKAAGAQRDLRGAIFAYNHATWYVDSVLLRAKLIGGMPKNLVDSLTGLTQGYFPVHAKARYADDPAEALKARGHGAKGKAGAVAQGVNIYARSGAAVIAAQDGQIVGMGTSKRLGQYIKLRDAFGNTYIYGNLKKLVRDYPVPKPTRIGPAQIASELRLGTTADPAPAAPATAGYQAPSAAPSPSASTPAASPAPVAAAGASPRASTQPTDTSTGAGAVGKERLYANPQRPTTYAAGGRDQLANQTQPLPASASLSSYFTQVFGLSRSDVELRPLRVGAKLSAGTIIARLGTTKPGVAPHVTFEIRPAGRHAPLIDAKPILDGWKLLEATSIYRAAGKNPFLGADAKSPSVGQIFLMSKDALAQRVLQDANVSIYACGRRDIQAGDVDRRLLTAMEYLSLSGMRPEISALKCGQPAGNSASAAQHSAGTAMDISRINGVPVLHHQGLGSIADITIRKLLDLQGLYRPSLIVSLMAYPKSSNTLALPDHADRIQVGYDPTYSSDPKLAARIDSALAPRQWLKLIDRLRTLQNPVVSTTPSKASIPDRPAASGSHG